MKSILISLVCLTSIFSASSSLAANKVGLAVDQGLGIVVQFTDINALTGNEISNGEYINAFIGNAGLSVDYIFKQGRFADDALVDWYVGGGIYYNWADRDDLGVRVPLGLTFPFDPKWDVYGQLAPELAFNHNDVKFGVDVAVGIRYEF